jgi:hypothetical protein
MVLNMRPGKILAMRTTTLAILLVVASLAAGMFALGRGTAKTDEQRARAAEAHGRALGVRDGRAAGVQEGRALERTKSLPLRPRAAAKAAFDAGYVAGANDVFGGFDGGWSLTGPYVVTIRGAMGPVTYRIDSRVPIRPGVNYYRCPQSPTVCQEPRRVTHR